MATKKQHFVPRVYIKAWETSVETLKEPNKNFQGIYMFDGGSMIGEGRNKDSILWKPHLYTIKFNQLYIGMKCPGVLNYFANEIYQEIINNDSDSVYGKLGYSIIKTKSSVQKHLMDIDSWEFYHKNGDVAKKNAILNRISNIRCYLLEDSFSELFESRWERIRDTFIEEVRNGVAVAYGQSERRISEKSAKDMLNFFFMMLCRSPKFDAMGIYTWISDMLSSAFESKSDTKEMMESIWFSELYRMFYKKTGGFYHHIINKAFENCQFILFEACSGSEMFITSDNPAFENNCRVLCENENGYIFPLTPKYMIFVAKGKENINVVDYRYANDKTVRHFNRIILNNCHSAVLGVKKHLSKMI